MKKSSRAEPGGVRRYSKSQGSGRVRPGQEAFRSRVALIRSKPRPVARTAKHPTKTISFALLHSCCLIRRDRVYTMCGRSYSFRKAKTIFWSKTVIDRRQFKDINSGSTRVSARFPTTTLTFCVLPLRHALPSFLRRSNAGLPQYYFRVHSLTRARKIS